LPNRPREPRRIKLAECMLCGALFPAGARLICWKHVELLRGPVPKNDITDDVTKPLPALG
jgi:hypothetical protein